MSKNIQAIEVSGIIACGGQGVDLKKYFYVIKYKTTGALEIIFTEHFGQNEADLKIKDIAVPQYNKKHPNNQIKVVYTFDAEQNQKLSDHLSSNEDAYENLKLDTDLWLQKLQLEPSYFK